MHDELSFIVLISHYIFAVCNEFQFVLHIIETDLKIGLAQFENAAWYFMARIFQKFVTVELNMLDYDQYSMSERV